MFPDKLIKRFNASFTVDPSGCWLWTEKVNAKGYGRFWYPRGASAHKFSFLLHVSMVPDGMVLDHICRVRHCVNPSHLRIVTPGFNTLIGNGAGARNARKLTCVRGHEFTRLIKNGKVVRVCKACQSANRKRRYYETRAAAIAYSREWYRSNKKLTGRMTKGRKLDFNKADEIRALKSKGISGNKIAELFGVTGAMVSAVLRGRCWVRQETHAFDPSSALDTKSDLGTERDNVTKGKGK